jgi:hypothetical protein
VPARDRLRAEPLDPLPERLGPDRPEFATTMRAHDAAVADGLGGYLDPSTGLFVMTAAFLADRGFCCGNGCRHCPYEP